MEEQHHEQEVLELSFVPLNQEYSAVLDAPVQYYSYLEPINHLSMKLHRYVVTEEDLSPLALEH
jgi:hypothetical protein